MATFILLNLLAIGAYVNARFTPDHRSDGPAGTGAVPAVERDGGTVVVVPAVDPASGSRMDVSPSTALAEYALPHPLMTMTMDPVHGCNVNFLRGFGPLGGGRT
ncbi:hypothetical protein U2F26_02330 [Micromonospora sp. 4G57]|uniref:Uncharacterized protein n=1 Tax=Micromonospora sicca TaxID=2202420 RepID=A0ABU5JBK2_9ACTN|nr:MULTISPECIES: hypothetical protein [unclassified Micromonospora]MDZ5441572.1 hypothetical protein [Micromonospora sp. 4G57]MDZ5489969.1 hypothetical protein [Micromonospora sp. 4G53]